MADSPSEMTTVSGGVGDARIAAQLAPDLEVLRSLGNGSTADVYLARDVGLRRLVAIKVLHRELASDQTTLGRFMREAQSAARVRHPNVIAIYRIGKLPDGVPYIVMEYIDGRILRDLVETVGALSLGRACALLASVAEALAATHDCGVVHRDVQPGNIYIENKTGRVVLGDFTIAALLDSGSTAAARLTQVGTRLGDTRYMSPEQLRDQPATERSDIYSFGVLAYEILAGRGPYEATKDARLLLAHLQDTPLPLTTLRDDMDPHAARLLEKCLAKDPNRRPHPVDIARGLQAQPEARSPTSSQRGPLGEFLAELNRRHVYRVMLAYGAVAAAIFGTAQVVFEAFDLPQRLYQLVVLVTLGGFPVSMVLSWLYDITSSGIRRTRSSATSEQVRSLKWMALGASIAVVALVGRFLLHGN